MIDYQAGAWSLGFIFTCRGSIFPKALAWTLPSSIAAYLFSHVYHEELEQGEWLLSDHVNAIWSSFSFVLGFLIVFRSQQAYARYWEGAMLLRKTRGEWFNAASSLIAFTSSEPQKRKAVETFQHLVVRLMSLLHCVSLHTIADMDCEAFPVISTDGLNADSLDFLKGKLNKNQQCEIITQWIQRLVVDSAAQGILSVPSPILTRFFQEISRGSVNISHARNLTDIPFPFPYAQLVSVLLLIHSIFTPIILGLLCRSPSWAAAITGISVFVYMSTHYIAIIIESPFGDDLNDLPLVVMQQDFNSSLWILLEKETQFPPSFTFDAHTHRRWDIDANFFGYTSEVSECPESPALAMTRRLSNNPSLHHHRKSLFSGFSTQTVESTPIGVTPILKSGTAEWSSGQNSRRLSRRNSATGNQSPNGSNLLPFEQTFNIGVSGRPQSRPSKVKRSSPRPSLKSCGDVRASFRSVGTAVSGTESVETTVSSRRYGSRRGGAEHWKRSHSDFDEYSTQFQEDWVCEVSESPFDAHAPQKPEFFEAHIRDETFSARVTRGTSSSRSFNLLELPQQRTAESSHIQKNTRLVSPEGWRLETCDGSTRGAEAHDPEGTTICNSKDDRGLSPSVLSEARFVGRGHKGTICL